MHARLSLVLILGLVFGAPLLLAAKKSQAANDTLPQLVSTGPKWKNVTELRHWAEQGDAQACFELGDRLLNGDGVAANEAEARRWLERAAQGGVADAMFRLGKMHHDGIGGPRDFVRALDFYGQAARAGVPEAQHNIGAMLVSGRGVKRDYVEGLAWLIVALKSGAVSEAEQKTRAHLAKRPGDIAAAEKRAAELIAALQDPATAAQATPRFTAGSATATADSGPRRPSNVPRPKVEPPKKVNVEVAPKLAPPKPEIDLPKN